MEGDGQNSKCGSLFGRKLAIQVQLFLNASGHAMTRSGFEYILSKHATTAASKQLPPSQPNGLLPHVLRHTCAIHILQATQDIRKVSLWLGHASLQSTAEIYLLAR